MLTEILLPGPEYFVRAEGMGYVAMDYNLFYHYGWIYATPVNGAVFDGWYDSEGQCLTHDHVLTGYLIQGLFQYTARFIGDILPGDADLSGAVDISDALLTLRFAMGLITMNDMQAGAADYNGDGTVDIQDALQILRHAMGIA